MASLRQSTPTLLPNDVGTIFSVESYHTFYRSPLLPISVTVIILAASYYALVRYLTPSATPDIAVPLLFSQLDDKTRADKYINDCLSILKEGYASFKDNSLGLYRMTTADSTEVVILHPKYLPELRDLPDPYLSFAHAIEKHLAGKWAHIADNILPWIVSIIKADLTPSLPRLMSVISEEIDLAMDRVMPPCDDWTPVKPFVVAQEIVAQVSARVFVGKPLCRNRQWQILCRDYTDLAFGASRDIKCYKPWQRPFVALFLPRLRGLLRARRDAIKFMKPIVVERSQRSQRAAAAAAAAATTDPKLKTEEVLEEELRDDFTEWMLRKAPPGLRDNIPLQAEIQCQLAVAAIHTTSMGLTHAMLDLVAHPEYTQALREEIVDVLAQNDGVYGRTTMQNLKKVDSFMKESQRFNPAGFTTFKRMVMQDFVLSDGIFLPKGTLIEVDGWLQYHDKEHGPYEDPEEFDGMRFYSLREKSKDLGSHQFFTSNNDYLQWGLGRHVCPGRFFASNEIKSVFSKFLLKYDMKLKDSNGPRPANCNFGAQIMPDPDAEILMRRRN